MGIDFRSFWNLRGGDAGNCMYLFDWAPGRFRTMARRACVRARRPGARRRAARASEPAPAGEPRCSGLLGRSFATTIPRILEYVALLTTFFESSCAFDV